MMMMEQSSAYQLTGNENGSSTLADSQEDATAINTSFNRGSGEMYESDEDDPEWKKWNAWTRRRMQLKRWQEAQARDPPAESAIGANRSMTVKQIQFSEPTLFLAACASGDYDEIDRLLRDCRVDINVSNVDGLTALHYACIDDNPPLVRHLLQAGANVNAVDNEGWSVLHATASCGHVTVAETLLQFGADPSLVNVDGELPIDLADDERMRTLLAENMRSHGLTDLERLRTQEHEHMRQDVMRMIQSGIYGKFICLFASSLCRARPALTTLSNQKSFVSLQFALIRLDEL
jgi:hypothetical protein